MVRLWLVLACGYVSSCLGRAEECEEYDREARVLCATTVRAIPSGLDIDVHMW